MREGRLFPSLVTVVSLFLEVEDVSTLDVEVVVVGSSNIPVDLKDCSICVAEAISGSKRGGMKEESGVEDEESRRFLKGDKKEKECRAETFLRENRKLRRLKESLESPSEMLYLWWTSGVIEET